MNQRKRLLTQALLCGLLGACAASMEAQSEPSASGGVESRTVNEGQMLLEGVPEIPAELASRLRAYSQVRQATFQSFTEDGSGIYVGTALGRVRQIHEVAMPGGARRQLTFSPEPISYARRQPGGRLVLFASDEGGNELDQLFLLDPATGRIRRLTDGEARNVQPQWSPDGRRIAYVSNRRDGRSNDVWVMEITKPEAARLVFQAPDPGIWWPMGWSRDGRRLLLNHGFGRHDLRVSVLDVEEGKARLVAGGPEAPAGHMAESFDASGEGIYLRTDAQSAWHALAYLHLDSGDLEVLTAELPWDVDRFALSPDGRRAAFVANKDAIDRLYLMDTTTHRYRRVEALPFGLVRNLGFSADGRHLALTLESARTPGDVYSLEVGDASKDGSKAPGELIRWTWSEIGGLDTESFVEPELVHYPTFDEVDGQRRRIPALLYKPASPGPHPVLVVLHGGPARQARPDYNSDIQQWIAELGAAAVLPNFRGSTGYGTEYAALDDGRRREDAVKDVGALLDWLATRPDLDADRVAVCGGSYGGYLALASLVHYSDRLRAGVDFTGISDFVTLLENTPAYRRETGRSEYGDERDPEMRAFLESISPLRRAREIAVPLLVIHGQNDSRVPVTEADQIVRAVREAGQEVWYVKALNEGHFFSKQENVEVVNQAIVLFLRRHLRGP